MQLSVHVGDTHLIEIDQGERTHTTPSERLDRPRTDPSESHDAHRGTGDPLVGFGADKLGKSHETVIV